PSDPMLRLHIQLRLATVLRVEHLNAEAAAQFESLIAGNTRLLGPLHPNTIAARLDACEAQRPDLAVACYERWFPDGDRVMGPSSRQMLTSRAFYGASLVDAGQ